jgi:hypothetical protein
MIIFDVVIFAFIFYISFLLHESMHSLEAYRQTGCLNSIIIDWKKGSMSMAEDCKSPNDEMVYLSGGVYSSIILFLLSMMSTGIFQFSFYSTGLMNLIYGIYEWKCKHNDRKIRWLIYSLCVILSLLLWK